MSFIKLVPTLILGLAISCVSFAKPEDPADCANDLSRPVHLQLPNLTDEALPPEIISEIKRHSVYSRTRAIAQTPHVFSTYQLDPGMKLRPMSKGEGIQSKMVLRYLKFLFPESRLVFAQDPEGSVRLYVRDESEVYSWEKNDPRLPMDLTKPINTAGFSLDRSKLRDQFGLDGQTKILSLYIKDHFSGEEFKHLLDELSRSWKVDVVFLNFNGGLRLVHPDDTLEEYKTPGYTGPKRLSEVYPSTLKRIGPAIIVNDLPGYLPYMHAMANAVAVIGLVNFFEPLTVNTPTVLLDTIPAKRSLVHLIELGKRSGGLKQVAESKELPGAILDFVTQPPNIVAPFKIEDAGKSQVAIFLDELEKWLGDVGILQP